MKSNFLCIYFYLSHRIHIQILSGRGPSTQEGYPDFLFDESSLGLGSPWVSSQFVDEMFWKRSRLLRRTQSQNKPRAFSSRTPITKMALSRRPPCSQDKLWAFRSKDGLGRGWTWNNSISVHFFGFGSVWCQFERWSNRTAMWSRDGAAYGGVRARIEENLISVSLILNKWVENPLLRYF